MSESLDSPATGTLYEPGPGLALPLGKSHVRSVEVIDGQAEVLEVQPMFEEREELFGWIAGQLDVGKQRGAEWAIVGMPCPVNMDWQTYGPSAAKGALHFEGSRMFYKDLVAADPAMRYLLDADPGFVSCRNDADLAGLAAAEFVRSTHGQPQHVFSLVCGSGNGGGMVIRRANGTYSLSGMPCEVGGVIPYRLKTDDLIPNMPKRTSFENLLSAPAIRRHTGLEPEALAPDHPYIQVMARALLEQVVMVDMIFDIDAVVISGGIGSGLADAYMPHVQRLVPEFEAAYSAYHRQQLRRHQSTYVMPPIVAVPVSATDSFEAIGAWGLQRLLGNAVEGDARIEAWQKRCHTMAEELIAEQLSG